MEVSGLKKIKDRICSSYNTVRSLAICFKHFDYVDGNRKLSKAELFEGLKSFGVALTKEEQDAVVKVFDKNGDGIIDFDEFLLGIRGKPNEKRQTMINLAFNKFDKDGSKHICVKDLLGVYNCKFHPDFIAKKKTEDQILKEFLGGLGDKNNDGTITLEEWNDYYASVSANIDNDDFFVDLMKNAWKL